MHIFLTGTNFQQRQFGIAVPLWGAFDMNNIFHLRVLLEQKAKSPE